jgi:hypothetical protein
VSRRLSLLIAVAGCNATPTPRPHEQPLDPIGQWESRDGFRLTIAANGRYEVCDDNVCEADDYAVYDPGYLILRNFFRLKVAQRFIRAADIHRACEQDRCAGPPNRTYIYPDDLEFLDNVAAVDEPRKCGDSECIILGNVEIARGTLRRSTRHSGS